MLHIPAVTLFAVQRVSRQFRDMVSTSTAIRRKLFLDLEEVEPLACYSGYGNPPGYDDPRSFRWLVAPPNYHPYVGNEGPFVPVRLNPL